MSLYDHQKKIVERNPSKILLAWETGTGKSLASLEWSVNGGRSHLFVVPKALKEKWLRDIKGYSREYPYHTFLVITKEEFRRDWKKLPRYDTTVADEAHYFSGMTSQMSKALYNYIKRHEPRVMLLTATPYMSTPWNIYTLARMLGHNWNYLDYKQRFFVDRYIGRRVVPQVKPGIEEDIAKLVRKIGDVVRLDECADVPDQVFETEFFKLTPDQDKAKKGIVEINPVVRFTKYHQIENGTLKGDEYTKDEFIECDKNARLLELAEENKKLAIVCRYNLQILRLKHFFMANLPKRKLYIIQGETKDKDEVVRAIEESDSCVVLINAACSEGYELPSVGVVAFASLSFSYKDYKQMLGRFLRINKLKKNVYLHLVTAEGVDQDVYKAIMNKQDFDMAIYAEAH